MTSSQRRFLSHSLIYLLPTLLVRGLSFLLTPVYARAMSPADYGVVGIATTLISLIGIVLGLALYASVGRLYVDCATDEEKARFLGTLHITLAIFPTGVAIALGTLGHMGLLSRFSSLPYSPELQIVIASSLFSIFPSLAAAVFTIREEPTRLARLNVATAAVQIAATLALVVEFRMGARGVLWSTLAANVACTIGALAMLAPDVKWRLDTRMLRRALAYSLPLLPHLMSNWAFAVSDRLILERSVDKSSIGEYSLAYMFSFAVSMVIGAVISAFGPVIQKTLKSNGLLTAEAQRLSTLAMGVIVYASLGAALLGVDAIRLLTPDGYQGATAYVALVVIGACGQGAALIVAQVTWFVERTGFVALVTMVAAAANIGLNILLIPTYGVPAAAATTALCGLGLFAMHAIIGRHVMPVRWPLQQWLLLFALGATVGIAGSLVPGSSWQQFGLHLVLLFVAFPLGLFSLRLVSVADLRASLSR